MRPALSPRQLVVGLSVAADQLGQRVLRLAPFMEPVERSLGLDRAVLAAGLQPALLAEGAGGLRHRPLIDRGHERAVISAALLLLLLVGEGMASSLAVFTPPWLTLGLGIWPRCTRRCSPWW